MVAIVILLSITVVVLGLLALASVALPHRSTPTHRLSDFLDGGQDEYREARHRREEEED